MITITGDASRSGQVRSEVKGLTLRDVFAGLAMQGLMSDRETATAVPAAIAKIAYAMADAMLEARKEQP